MSRGFGVMQRTILEAVAELSTTPWSPDPRWFPPLPLGCVPRGPLAAAVRRRGTPGRGFDDGFSRALRGLVQRGALVPVDPWTGQARPTERRHVQCVRLP